MSIGSSNSKKICSLCLKYSDENTEKLFGPWMKKSELNVHYFCLLLSTNLPQRGEDCGGICGFLLRDIRAEIVAAKKRNCEFCDEVGASISCGVCKCYFHLKCGLRNLVRFEYTGEFKSYCSECYTLDEVETEAQRNWKNRQCYICKDNIGSVYSPTDHLYASCCKKGFVHRSCMQEYAMSAGYYLRCIWCRKISFRESIKTKGIFVPDREAQWETRSAYRDLHRGHRHCDMEICRNPQGREHSTKKWKLINCSYCGSFGVHYPLCLPIEERNCKETEFKCDTCALTEKTISHSLSRTSHDDTNSIDTTIYVLKQNQNENVNPTNHDTVEFSQNYESIPNKESNILLDKENAADDVNVFILTPEKMETSTVINDVEIIDLTEEEKLDESPKKKAVLENEANIRGEDIIENMDVDDFNYEVFDTYEFTPDYRVIGSCKFRLNMNSPRFAGKSIEEILSIPGLLLESDVLERNNDIGIFKKVNEYLDKIINISERT